MKSPFYSGRDDPIEKKRKPAADFAFLSEKPLLKGLPNLFRSYRIKFEWADGTTDDPPPVLFRDVPPSMVIGDG